MAANTFTRSCRVCFYSCPRLDGLKVHVEAKHGADTYTHSCRECFYSCSRLEDLKRHVEAKHGVNTYTHSCRECFYSCSLLKDLKRHVESAICGTPPCFAASTPADGPCSPHGGVLVCDASTPITRATRYACENHAALLLLRPGVPSLWRQIPCDGALNPQFGHNFAAPVFPPPVGGVGPFDSAFLMRPLARPISTKAALGASLNPVAMVSAVDAFLALYPLLSPERLFAWIGLHLADGTYNHLDIIFGANEATGIAECAATIQLIRCLVIYTPAPGAMRVSMLESSTGGARLLGLLRALGLAPGAKTVTHVFIDLMLTFANGPKINCARALLGGMFAGDGSGFVPGYMSFSQSTQCVGECSQFGG